MRVNLGDIVSMAPFITPLPFRLGAEYAFGPASDPKVCEQTRLNSIQRFRDYGANNGPTIDVATGHNTNSFSPGSGIYATVPQKVEEASGAFLFAQAGNTAIGGASQSPIITQANNYAVAKSAQLNQAMTDLDNPLCNINTWVNGHIGLSLLVVAAGYLLMSGAGKGGRR